MTWYALAWRSASRWPAPLGGQSPATKGDYARDQWGRAVRPEARPEILVLGVTGFIGQELARQVLERRTSPSGSCPQPWSAARRPEGPAGRRGRGRPVPGAGLLRRWRESVVSTTWPGPNVKTWEE